MKVKVKIINLTTYSFRAINDRINTYIDFFAISFSNELGFLELLPVMLVRQASMSVTKGIAIFH